MKRPEAKRRDAKPLRRRGATLEAAILEAAWTILTECGYHGFTYEAVAARAGTSRAVLYRRWPQREELLLAAVAAFRRAAPITVPETGNLRDDALGFLRNADVGRARMMTLLSMQIMDYFRDSGSSFNELRAILHVPGEPTACESIVARAVARGELEDVPRSSRVVNLPFDLYRHEAFMSMRPVSDQAITQIVDEVWLPLLKVLPSRKRQGRK